jgi:hypothetical protein
LFTKDLKANVPCRACSFLTLPSESSGPAT